MKSTFKPLDTCQVLENVEVLLPNQTTYTAPYANVLNYNAKTYVQLFVPGIVRIISIPAQFGNTQFTANQVRNLLAGGYEEVSIKNGTCDVYFDIELIYDGQSSEFTGGITFGHHRK